MEVIKNYLNYKKHKPEYSDWENEKNKSQQARIDYIKKYGVSDSQKQEDIKRAKIILNAVDTMDEYSQAKAEDMEMVVQTAKNAISAPIAYISAGVGLILNLVKPLNKMAKNIAAKLNVKQMSVMVLPAITGLVASVIAAPFVSSWSAKKELQASREGRIEAMQNDLLSVKQFAVLTDSQEQKRDEIAKDIVIEKQETKKIANATNGLGIKDSIAVIKSGDEKYQEYYNQQNKKLQEDIEKFDSVKLSDDEITEAKKDKQLIQNVVQKIDIASQDYAENIELATGVFETLALGSGGLLGIGLNKLLNFVSEHTKDATRGLGAKLNKIGKNSKIISAAVGLSATILGVIYATKLQKQSSRVARFKVKEELMKNPEQLIYVDDDKIDTSCVEVNKNKKDNFFKFLFKAVKDNKEYNKYLKTDAIENKKKFKANEQIEIDESQKKRAYQLQQNVFKMFNKIDEKSQSYSESTEAIGETIQDCLSLIPAAFMSLGIFKIGKSFNERFKSFIPTAISTALAIGASIIITKEQKKASRVADMIAIKEMDDYRHFVNYQNIENNSTKNIDNNLKKPLTMGKPPWEK